MTAIRAKVHNGRIEPIDPLNLPEGTELLVTKRGETDASEQMWDDSPEAIEAWIGMYDSLEPLVFTAEERAAIEEDREARKRWELEHAEESAKKLRELWQ